MPRIRVAALTLSLAVVCVGCSSGSPSATTTTGRAASRTTTTSTTGAGSPTSRPTTTTTAGPGLSVQVTAVPAVAAIGATVTFTVVVHGAGVLSGEAVAFGDGATTGANAGMITCGQTARADATRTYTHVYATSGTFRFTDDVSVLGPPPSCAHEATTGTATVVVAADVVGATAAGAFQSPTRNLACLLALDPSSQVRCVSFAPPLLVSMTPDGALTRCTGSSCLLGNPSPDTPFLAYGAAVGNSTFVCISRPAGITCTVPSGRGFTISKAGVATIGS